MEKLEKKIELLIRIATNVVLISITSIKSHMISHNIRYVYVFLQIFKKNFVREPYYNNLFLFIFELTSSE